MIRWLIQTTVDHPDLAAGRPPAGLLTAAEKEQFANFLNPRRRRDWLLGRWTAKRLAQAHSAATQGFSPALDTFTIEHAVSGAPYIASNHPALAWQCGDRRVPLALAISHSRGYAFCALCASRAEEMRLGADIELVEPRHESFAQEFFTTEEQHLLKNASPTLRQFMTTAMWSIKEAVLKAAHLGLRADPRLLQCRLRPERPRHWTPVQVGMEPAIGAHLDSAGPLRVWWRVIDNRLLPGRHFVLTIAAFGKVDL